MDWNRHLISLPPPSQEQDPPKAVVNLPYIRHLSESVRQILNPLGNRACFCPYQTLRWALIHLKDHIPPQQWSGVVCIQDTLVKHALRCTSGQLYALVICHLKVCITPPNLFQSAQPISQVCLTLIFTCSSDTITAHVQHGCSGGPYNACHTFTINQSVASALHVLGASQDIYTLQCHTLCQHVMVVYTVNGCVTTTNAMLIHSSSQRVNLPPLLVYLLSTPVELVHTTKFFGVCICIIYN